MAAALTSEVDQWHPGLARIIGPIAYGTAGLVGLVLHGLASNNVGSAGDRERPLTERA
jgi:hypothetical protein